MDDSPEPTPEKPHSPASSGRPSAAAELRAAFDAAGAAQKIRSIEQLLHSHWGRLAQDPEMRRKIPAMLRSLLERIPSSHPVVNRIRLALRLFERESSGGLVNSRNLIILSAALLYTFWPADAIPDLLPLVGWLDDVGLLTLVLTTLAESFRKGAPSAEAPPHEEDRPEEAAPSQTPPDERVP